MEFKDTQAIYLQIVDWMCDNIVKEKWKSDERIPSVRELGILLEVNPNTVMRAYECLQNQHIIYNETLGSVFLSVRMLPSGLRKGNVRSSSDKCCRSFPPDEIIGYFLGSYSLRI